MTLAARELAVRRRAANRPAPAVASRSKPSAGAMLDLQRTIGNLATSRVLRRVTPGSTPAGSIQRMTANSALTLIAKMTQHARAVSNFGEARKLLDMRAEVEEIKAAGGSEGGNRDIGTNLEWRLDAVRNYFINNAPPGVNMEQQINNTTKDEYNAAMELVNAGGGTAPTLGVAMLAAKLNRHKKMDLRIRDGTTRQAVRAAALADGYRLFAHAAYTEVADATDPDERVIALDTPTHPNRTLFDTHIKTWLADHSFPTYDGENGDIRVYTDPTHPLASLQRALADWHPGIASDKTDSGQFREDDPHPNVANQTHNSHAHTHLQAPGCMQTTIVL
jgi:hypothetical protein